MSCERSPLAPANTTEPWVNVGRVKEEIFVVPRLAFVENKFVELAVAENAFVVVANVIVPYVEKIFVVVAAVPVALVKLSPKVLVVPDAVTLK